MCVEQWIDMSDGYRQAGIRGDRAERLKARLTLQRVQESRTGETLGVGVVYHQDAMELKWEGDAKDQGLQVHMEPHDFF